MDKHKIEARELVNDIRAGMTGTDLMRKYRLSELGLKSALTKLVQAGLINTTEISRKGSGELGSNFFLIFDPGCAGLKRRWPRFRVPRILPVYDAKTVLNITGGGPSNMGRVRDLHEKGIGTDGIEAERNEVKTLVIIADEIIDLEPIYFRARCRWIQYDAAQVPIAGFEMVSIPRATRHEIRRLIELYRDPEVINRRWN
jgi:hypothetical protein